MPHPYWPLFDLRVRTPRLELRAADDDLGTALAALAAKGIHDPATMPFGFPWTDVPSPELERNSVQHYWQSRAEWRPEKWGLPMAVLVDGEVVGTQGVNAEQFPVVRTVETGSWLGQAFQGQGIGKEMRAAVLHFVFAGLDAEVAYSGAWEDNAPSLAVSKSLGYEENGDVWLRRRNERARQIKLKLERSAWEARRRDDIVIENLEPCLEMFGLAP